MSSKLQIFTNDLYLNLNISSYIFFMIINFIILTKAKMFVFQTYFNKFANYDNENYI